MKNFCGTCGEIDLGCNQLGCWKAPARSGASGMVLEAIEKEAILSQRKPKYSLKVSIILGAVILACELTGVYLAVRHGY
jgi:hypothetical protein